LKLAGAREWEEFRYLAGGLDRRFNGLAPDSISPAA
jgi:hypothetical protein